MWKKVIGFLIICYTIILIGWNIEKNNTILTWVNDIIELDVINDNISPKLINKYLTWLNGSWVIDVKKENNKYYIKYIFPNNAEKRNKIIENIKQRVVEFEKSEEYYQCVLNSDLIKDNELKKYFEKWLPIKEDYIIDKNDLTLKVLDKDIKEVFWVDKLKENTMYYSIKPQPVKILDFFQNKFFINAYVRWEVSNIERSTWLVKEEWTTAYYWIVKFKKKGNGIVIKQHNKEKLDIIKDTIVKIQNWERNSDFLKSINEDVSLVGRENVIWFFKDDNSFLLDTKVKENEIIIKEKWLMLIERDELYMLVISQENFNILSQDKIDNLLVDRIMYIFNQNTLDYIYYKVPIINSDENNFWNECSFIKKKRMNVYID